jgi:hypothetical protein
MRILLELITWKRFSSNVSDLLRRSHILNDDQRFGHVGAEMMGHNRDVLGTGPQLGALSKLHCTNIVLEDLAPNSGNLHGSGDAGGDEFVQQLHDVNDVM